MVTKHPEILAPAGSLEIMKQAFQAGADAVYLGGQMFGARAFATNLSETELVHGIEYAKLHHKKLYLTVNTLLKNEEIDRLFSYLKTPYEAGLDAVIVQDLGVADCIHKWFPELELHASTQMSITSPYGGNLLKEAGFSRIVPARELSMAEILKLKEETGMEIEIFVHGALCYSFSGQCLLSSMIGGRSGNRGRCAQPCRQQYALNNGQVGYYFSPKDLCALQSVPELINMGIDSFKIEGRMKKAEYVISAVNAYRRAIDACMNHQAFDVEAEQNQLADIYNRGNFTGGYFHLHNGKEMMSMERNHHNGLLIGTVETIQGGAITLQLMQNLNPGDILEIRTSNKKCIEITSGIAGSSGDTVVLNAKNLKQIQPGNLVYRTKNHVLCQEYLEENSENRLKENIHISVTMKKDLSAMIKVRCGECLVEVTGSKVLQAKNQPLKKEVIQEKLYKLGDMPFRIQSLDLDMDEDCFFSMKEWNQLRRQALQALLEQCIKAGRRQIRSEQSNMHKEISVSTCKSKTTAQWAVQISTIEQLEQVLLFKMINRIDLELERFSMQELDACLTKIHNQKKQCYIVLPRIYRMDMEQELQMCVRLPIDGFIVRTIDQLAFLKNNLTDKPIVCDFSVYTYNRSAAFSYQNLWPNIHLTLPVELNRQELKNLVDTTNSAWEWIVYGKQSVMVTAQCLAKNTDNCHKKSGYLKLTNDYQDTYQIHHICKYCYNTVFQEDPTCLFPFLKDWQIGDIQTYRILLTTENAQETREILEHSPSLSDYRGHYKKGIE